MWVLRFALCLGYGERGGHTERKKIRKREREKKVSYGEREQEKRKEMKDG